MLTETSVFIVVCSCLYFETVRLEDVDGAVPLAGSCLKREGF